MRLAARRQRLNCQLGHHHLEKLQLSDVVGGVDALKDVLPHHQCGAVNASGHNEVIGVSYRIAIFGNSALRLELSRIVCMSRLEGPEGKGKGGAEKRA